MTRKHYNQLAETYGKALALREDMREDGYRDAILHTLDVLKSENPRFDRDRFLSVVESQIAKTRASYGLTA